MAVKKTLSTAVANPLRTGVQGGVAYGITEILDSFNIIPMDERQYGAVLLVLTIGLGALQNGIENLKGVGILRRPSKQVALLVKAGDPSVNTPPAR